PASSDNRLVDETPRLARSCHHPRRRGRAVRRPAARRTLVHADRVDGICALRGRAGRAADRTLLSHDRSRRGPAPGADVDRGLVPASAWLVPLVSVAFALLLEPLYSRAGRPSWLADLRGGNASRLFGLLGAGLVCGVLWEFWNYWAATKWTYTVPYVGGVKIFEMPVLGYLGFPAFALECFAMYHWLRGVLRAAPAPPLP